MRPRVPHPLVVASVLCLSVLPWLLSPGRVFAAQTLYVTTTQNVGCGDPAGTSLACAIDTANSDGRGDTIDFSQLSTSDPGYDSNTGVWSFSFTSNTQLPTLTADSTTINGYTAPNSLQASYVCLPRCSVFPALLTVQLVGAGEPTSGSGVTGLNITGSFDTVRGLSFVNWYQAALSFAGYNGSATGGSITGNWFGYDAYSGDAQVNFGDDIELNGTSGVLVGGTSPAAINVISNAYNAGVHIGSQSTSNTVEGNWIGSNVDGTGVNGHCNNTGILLDNGTSSNTIGGSASGAGNYITSACTYGIEDAGSSGTTIAGNTIGVTYSGANNGNSNGGIYLHGGVSNALVTGNTITNNGGGNGGPGVDVGDGTSSSDHVEITRNSIYANAGLGISFNNVETGGCTSGGTGPNDLLPCPTILTANTQYVAGKACGGCTVEVYLTDNPPDATGYGEGQTYLGSAVAGSVSGRWSLPFSSGQTTAGQTITATATTGSAPIETSQFAANATVGNPTGITISAGWNLLAVPTSSVSTASGLISSLNAVSGVSAKMLATYTNGRYRVYVPGYSADQPLSGGQGVFVLNNGTSGTWMSPGTPYGSGQTAALVRGWNLVSAPYPQPGSDTDAIAGETEACRLQEIATYTGSGYQTWLPGQAATTIPSASGMWILCAGSASWTPS